MIMNNRNGGESGGLGGVLGGLLAGQQGGGGIGDVLGGLLGGGASGGAGALGSVLGSVLGGGAHGTGEAGGSGGLGGLLEQFQRAGYGDQVNSWVGQGENLPISPDAIGQVFGSDALSRIAQQVGVSEEDAAQGLSQLLPDVVNHLTPDGSAPDLDQLAASVSALARRFGG
jgi:uncharacterized protein YidB (DUF937 family)